MCSSLPACWATHHCRLRHLTPLTPFCKGYLLKSMLHHRVPRHFAPATLSSVTCPLSYPHRHLQWLAESGPVDSLGPFWPAGGLGLRNQHHNNCTTAIHDSHDDSFGLYDATLRVHQLRGRQLPWPPDSGLCFCATAADASSSHQPCDLVHARRKATSTLTQSI